MWADSSSDRKTSVDHEELAGIEAGTQMWASAPWPRPLVAGLRAIVGVGAQERIHYYRRVGLNAKSARRSAGTDLLDLHGWATFLALGGGRLLIGTSQDRDEQAH